MQPYDAELIVDKYGKESIVGVAPETIPNFVREIIEGYPVEKKCRIYGCKEAGDGIRQLCEEHDREIKLLNCGAKHCGNQAKGFLNVALTEEKEFRECMQLKMNDASEHEIKKD